MGAILDEEDIFKLSTFFALEYSHKFFLYLYYLIFMTAVLFMRAIKNSQVLNYTNGIVDLYDQLIKRY